MYVGIGHASICSYMPQHSCNNFLGVIFCLLLRSCCCIVHCNLALEHLGSSVLTSHLAKGVLGLHVHATTISFLCDLWGWSSGPWDCIASTFIC